MRRPLRPRKPGPAALQVPHPGLTLPWMGADSPGGGPRDAGGGSSGADRRIAVVSGLPRSGTSLMMQMLAAGGLAPFCDGVRAPDADNPHGYFEHEGVKALARDAGLLRGARGRAVKVIAPLLAQLPPGEDYRVILMERDLAEVVASQDRMLARRGSTATALPRERLIEVLAIQLGEAREAVARLGIPALAIGYADVLQSGAGCARRVADFLGLALDLDAMARAVDASLRGARAPG